MSAQEIIAFIGNAEKKKQPDGHAQLDQNIQFIRMIGIKTETVQLFDHNIDDKPCRKGESDQSPMAVTAVFQLVEGFHRLFHKQQNIMQRLGHFGIPLSSGFFVRLRRNTFCDKHLLVTITKNSTTRTSTEITRVV